MFGKKGGAGAGGFDVEMGVAPPSVMDAKMRWGFIRKVYSILCIELIITFGIALAMMLTPPVKEYFRSGHGIYIMIALIIFTFVLSMAMFCCQQRHPWNYILMFLFTFAMGVMVGAVSTQSKGEFVLMAAGLTLIVTVGLTVFTFIASARGMDFSFLAPFLLCASLLITCFALMRIFLPGGGSRLFQQVMGCITALVFSGFIIYDTESVIKRHDYDDYILAAMSLFMDIIQLFLSILSILGGRN